MNAGITSSQRFEETGDMQDLDNSIIQFCEALKYAPDHVPLRSSCLMCYSASLLDRFNRQNNSNDRDEGILRFREAVELELPTDDPPTLSTWMTQLARILVQRFEQQGDNSDLEDAIQYSQRAAELAPHGRLNHFSLLSLAAVSLRERFLKNGDRLALNRAILQWREILEAPPAGIDPQTHSTTMFYLARSHLERFEHEADRQDLDNAVLHSRRAVALAPDSGSEHVGLLASAALKLRQHACTRGNERALDDAITFLREALDYGTDPSRRMVVFLQLSSAHLERFIRLSDQQDLDGAALRFLDALEMHLLGNFGDSGNTIDAFSFLEAMLEMRNNQGVRGEGRNMANVQRRGATLDDAVIILRHSAKLCPSSHSNYPYILHCLGKALCQRHKLSSDDQDLNEAIESFEAALGHLRGDHPIRPELLYDITSSLSTRGGPHDTQNVVRYGHQALELLPPNHQYRPILLISLASTLHRCYAQSGEKSAIDETIFYHSEFRKQLDVSSKFGNPFSTNLLDLLESYLRQVRDNPKPPLDDKILDDLFLKAEEMEGFFGFSEITEMSGASGPLKLLGDIFCLRFESKQQRDPRTNDSSLQTATDYFKAATEHKLSSPFQRLQASIRWVYNAEKYHHDSALDAYGHCLRLLDIHLATTASIDSRYQMRKDFPPYQAVNAASCALRQGDCSRAVEMLEQGRTLIWTQLARHLTPVHELLRGDDHSVELVNRFVELVARLHTTPTLSENTDKVSAEAAARSYKSLMDDWDNIIADIRKVDEFSRFLLPPQFSELQEAAADGPVIILSASFYSCDAIIISSKSPSLHIPLQTTIEELVRLANRLRKIVRQTRTDPEQDKHLRGVLQQLWDTVVCPVIDALERFTGKKSRIWWCPASFFAYLPIHAAGDYSQRNGRHLSQLYISSYTPSLSALIKARREYKKMTKTKKFAAIGQAQPTGGSLPLESVESEIDFVYGIVRRHVQAAEVTKLPSSKSTTEAALRALRDNTWLHFACHGIQEFEKPYDSCLCMLDGPLSLYDITQTDLRNHEFAFLSACETAVGEMETPDEVIHLAAGLQFTGVKSVVGTMWEVEDATVHNLVKAFYKNMFADGEMDCRNAAQALHKALRSPDVKKMPLAQRVVFVHVGI
ncbi:hypothetical protein M378DRAFT_169612 [Amanita muscaria Koide BX008]|uniref:CHAT domain-containing protein n=1 Tax=Amanita muscaria (strain Koide BX008) TaxID=946122 RepID=A0A0C2SYI2_AMAMK|nr:hypothetical protein M378DRAFT_169612 [Amanita muscaria Koide BX008]